MGTKFEARVAVATAAGPPPAPVAAEPAPAAPAPAPAAAALAAMLAAALAAVLVTVLVAATALAAALATAPAGVPAALPAAVDAGAPELVPAPLAGSARGGGEEIRITVSPRLFALLYSLCFSGRGGEGHFSFGGIQLTMIGVDVFKGMFCFYQRRSRQASDKRLLYLCTFVGFPCFHSRGSSMDISLR